MNALILAALLFGAPAPASPEATRPCPKGLKCLTESDFDSANNPPWRNPYGPSSDSPGLDPMLYPPWVDAEGNMKPGTVPGYN